MHWKYVLHCAYASLICNLIAAPTANEIGPHQIVFDNDLTVSRSAGKAIVLLSNITAEEASSRCKSLGESLLSIPTDSEDLQGLSDQLNYLSSSNTRLTCDSGPPPAALLALPSRRRLQMSLSRNATALSMLYVQTVESLIQQTSKRPSILLDGK